MKTLEPNSLGAALRELREKAGLGPIKVAAPVLGVSHGSLGAYEREETLPDVDFLATFAAKTGADFNELLRLRLAVGKTEEARRLAETFAAHDLGKGAPTFQQAVPVGLPLRHKEGNEVELSEVAELSFRKEWLEARGLEAHDLILLMMPDDSMVPTIRDGNLVVVDCSSDGFRGDGLYTLMYDGKLAVKRLQTDFGGGLWVRSDNSAYREQHFDVASSSKLNIVGRVIWSGGEV